MSIQQQEQNKPQESNSWLLRDGFFLFYFSEQEISWKMIKY